MDKIKLKDSTEYEILEGASLDAIKIEVSDFEKIKEISDSFTKENLKEVKFLVDENVTGEYTNLVLTNISFVSKEVIAESPELSETSDEETDTTATDENEETLTSVAYVVTVSLRESTEVEVRLNALEEKTNELEKGQNINTTTIEAIVSDVIPSMMDNESNSDVE